MELVRGIEMRKSYLEVKNLSKQFQVGQQTLEVFKNINFSIQKGEFICIVGGSGCGKSTLLRALAGLDADHGGKVTIDGEEILKPRKDRGVVFQESRLFPWLTVEENVKFALDEGKEEDKRKKVQEVLELVNLKGFEKHLPKALSGGMAQRTNIARALVNNPPILFLDEPFGALDAFTKMQLQEELINIKYKEETTMIMITHDIDEAIYLADKIIVMGKQPGGIKDIICIDLPRPRNRNHYYFTELRKRIYEYFFEFKEIVEEYNI